MNQISYPPGFRARRGLNWGAIGFMYASYYMCRYNFRFAGPGMNAEFGFDKTDLANIWVIWSLAYGTGQLVNGLFTDRIGGKWSMLIGAIGTIACNFIFGFSSFIGTLSTFALRLALGELSHLLLDSIRVRPAKPLALGYRFRHPTLEEGFLAEKQP